MARITDSHLGTPSGKLGKVIFKNRNRKTFSQLATEAYKETSSEKVKKNRNVFREVTLFSNFANRIPIVKHIWKKTNISPGKASNIQIFMYNHDVIRRYGISSHCRILPHYLPMIEAGVRLDEDYLTFKFNIDTKSELGKLYSDFKVPFIFVAVVRMEEPVSDKAEYKMANLRLEERVNEGKLSQDSYTQFTFNTEKKKFKMMKGFNKIIVYPAVICLDAYQQPYKWAECGGIYIKGSDPVKVITPEPEPVQKPGVFFDIEYR